MNFTETRLKGCFVTELTPFIDERGWFARTFCKNEFKEISFNEEWVQINHSFTKQKGTIRGLHFQNPPFAEIKLIRCIAGCIFDVIVDIRESSPTFLQWFGIELSAQNKKLLYIPQGFAHGFQTLTDDCELIYHHSEFYKPNAENGLRYDDPAINIKWILPPINISQRDSNHLLINKNFKGI